MKCIIEDCGYTSVWDEFSLQLKDVFGLPSFPLLDVANLVCNVRAGYDFHKASSAEQLKRATVPMLFIHGDQDTFVPYSMLDQNYDACASKVKQSSPSMAPPTPRVRKLTQSSTGTQSTTSSTSIFRK